MRHLRATLSATHDPPVHPTRRRPESPRDPYQLSHATPVTRDRPWRWCAQRRRHAGPCPYSERIRHAPSATAQRLIEANALPPDFSTHFHPSTACRDLLPRRVQGARLCWHPPRGGTCSLHYVLAGDFVYGHTCTCSALVHPRRPLGDSRTSRAVQSRDSTVSMPASNVRRPRLLRPARCPPSMHTAPDVAARWLMARRGR